MAAVIDDPYNSDRESIQELGSKCRPESRVLAENSSTVRKRVHKFRKATEDTVVGESAQKPTKNKKAKKEESATDSSSQLRTSQQQISKAVKWRWNRDAGVFETILQSGRSTWDGVLDDKGQVTGFGTYSNYLGGNKSS